MAFECRQLGLELVEKPLWPIVGSDPPRKIPRRLLQDRRSKTRAGRKRHRRAALFLPGKEEYRDVVGLYLAGDEYNAGRPRKRAMLDGIRRQFVNDEREQLGNARLHLHVAALHDHSVAVCGDLALDDSGQRYVFTIRRGEFIG